MTTTVPEGLKEKVRIYLTDQNRSRSTVENLSRRFAPSCSGVSTVTSFPNVRLALAPAAVRRGGDNAWVLKMREEPLANDMSPDPDAYYKYLRNRLESDNHPTLVRRLDYVYKRANPNASGQTKLTVFLKGDK